jgi:hypothetical protein
MYTPRDARKLSAESNDNPKSASIQYEMRYRYPPPHVPYAGDSWPFLKAIIVVPQVMHALKFK